MYVLKKGAPISEEKGNTNLHFEQGIVHKEYLDHLYNLFAGYCNSAPNISDRLPDKRTNKIYTRIQFVTYSLPCFNYLYDLFYFEGKKFVPLNIEEHFTALSLAYWLCDDGYYDKKNKRVIFATAEHSYSLEEISLLKDVLTNKFNLTCFINKHNNGFILAIATNSAVPADLKKLVGTIMPKMFLYKIGL